MTDEEIRIITKCSQSPVYFASFCTKNMLHKQQVFLLNCFHNGSTFAVNSRNSGTTLSNAIYLLWISIFDTKKCHGYFSNNITNARVISDEIIRLNNNLPDFLKVDIKSSYNSLHFSHTGSSIFYHPFIANSLVGRTFDTIIIDNFAYCNKNKLDPFFFILKSTKLIVTTSLAIHNFSVFDFIKGNGLDKTMNVQVIPYSSCSNFTQEFKNYYITNFGQEAYDYEYECIEQGVTYA